MMESRTQVKINFENTGSWNRYFMETVPCVGDEIYILEGDGSKTLIKVFKIRHLADRDGNKADELSMYCKLAIWGTVIEHNSSSDSYFI